MELTIKNKKNLLIERIKNNYYGFLYSLGGVSRSRLIEMAERIAAVKETHEMLTEYYDWDEEGEIDFYLLFRDPLTIIADAWEHSRNEMIGDFDGAMFDVSYSDKIISEYPLIDGVDRELYGKIMSFPC